jgi:GNAT superfamily N-acetyltransferase
VSATQPTPTTDPRLIRALAFERAMHAALGRVVTAAWGQVFLDPAIGRCYERNHARVDGDAAGLDAPALDRDLDRLFGAAGLQHRQVLVEPPAAERLAAGLASLGYDAQRNVYCAFAGEAPPPPRAPIREVDIEAIVAANERYLRTDPETTYGRDEVVRRHICEHHRTYGSAGAHERCFAVADERDDAVAWAKLWVRDGEAQVEDVVCLAEYRGRGYGRDVVAAATRAALQARPELLFIVADDADWPKQLYGRLGYAPLGVATVHTRHAPGFRWGAPTPVSPGRT